MEIQNLLHRLKPFEKSCSNSEYIEERIAEGPSRPLDNNWSNVKSVFPSGLNGTTRGSESLQELLAHLLFEYHPLVLGYFEQTPQIMLKRPYAKGERLTKYTPDGGVVLKNGTNLVYEVKYSSEIEADIQSEHPRFSRTEDGRYQDPKAKEYFLDRGIHFLVITELDFGKMLESARVKGFGELLPIVSACTEEELSLIEGGDMSCLEPVKEQ